jgi:DNA-binding transcriptional regulator PaaX
MMLSRMVQQGWIEIQGKNHNTVVRLTEAGLEAMRSPV